MVNRWLHMNGRGVGANEPEEGSEFSVDQFFESIEANPLGRLLKIISGLPEMRAEKLEIARRHLQQPESELDAEMDAAIDKVLEELISE